MINIVLQAKGRTVGIALFGVHEGSRPDNNFGWSFNSPKLKACKTIENYLFESERLPRRQLNSDGGEVIYEGNGNQMLKVRSLESVLAGAEKPS